MANIPSPTMLERLLDAIVEQLTPDAAQVFSDLYAPDDVKARIDALVEKIMNGGLEPAEQDEYDGLMQVVHTISMIQDRIESKLAGPRPAADAPPLTYIESIDDGSPPVIPRPTRTPTPVQLDGLEAMLDDLDENMRPRRRD
ncbi:hypothetical protein [Paludisphaera mucosa]|uniref:Uncharacterized protein n=1 Tax=Paludisphaera mucosa TaxID=3030827 RepID=A0ABT6FEM7_9BACT|nr:hypothetical protein [Paludisphaera mucosa]MDG3006033.1 hypothetical protein [Paludisphaera mucosa]